MRTTPISAVSQINWLGNSNYETACCLQRHLSGQSQLIDSLRNQLSRQFQLVDNLQNHLPVRVHTISINSIPGIRNVLYTLHVYQACTWYTEYPSSQMQILESFGKQIEWEHKFAQGKYDVDLLGRAFDFKRFFTTSFELRAVDRSVFCHLSPRPVPPVPIPITSSPPSPLSKPPRSSRLRVLFLVSFDEHLAIDRPVRPCSRLACCCRLRLLHRCYTSSWHTIT